MNLWNGAARISNPVFYFLFVCLILPQLVFGNDISPLALQALADTPQWRLLLQYSPGAGQSDLKESFFLSETGHRDPQAELAALVTELNTPGSDVRCRFPARTLWLSHQLHKPEWQLAECKALNEWARLDEVEGISLILVSGYLGNPASSFGHSLMKIRYQGETRKSHLMGLGINFGADVPDSEPMILYITRGLFGGYDAAFADNTFYAHDQTYTRSEFRDLWEYPLNLDDYQVRLIIYALWELKGQRFDYYFLTKNCGYRLAQLVQLSTGQNLLDNVGPWYFPVELFEDLEQDTYREPIFHPSAERTLIARIRALPAGSKTALREIVSLQLDSAPVIHTFAPLEQIRDAEEQQKILDALLAFYEFHDIANQYGEQSPWNVYRTQALAFRYRLPVSSYQPAAVDERISAKDTDRPAGLRVSLGQTNGQSVALLGYKGVDYDATSFTDLLGSELEVLGVSIGYDKEQVFLQELKLVDVTRIMDINDNLPGYWPISWSGKAGWLPETYSCFDCVTFSAAGGVGIARSLSSTWMTSAFINLIYLHSISSAVAEAEWRIFNHSRSDYSLEAGIKYGSKSVTDEDYKLAFLNVRIEMADNLNARLNIAEYLDDELDGQVQLGIEYRF